MRVKGVNELSVIPRVPSPIWLVIASIVGATPLLALWVGGSDLAPYLEFPPRKLYVPHASFSPLWWSFYAVASCLLLSVTVRSVKTSLRFPEKPGLLTLGSFTLLMISWVIAWNRWSIFAFIQPHTFLLLWLSYIFFMNSLLWEIHGSCPFLTHTRRYFLSFPVSALFWWGFEFLNRFTQNWYYLEVAHYTALSYALLATLSFATVLPSMWVTKEFLQKTLLVERAPRREWNVRSREGLGLNCIALCILALLPFLPDYLFGGIWVVPLALVIGLQRVKGVVTIIRGGVAMWSLAGLWCGFLWELWNVLSVAKWIYLIPFVEKYHLFEMPVVGYGGYLPFGVLCGLIIESVQGGEDA